MDESSSARVPASDAEILNTIRSGDSGAYALLRERHATAARRLAGQLAGEPTAADDTIADEVVATAFTRVIDAIQRGGGPTDAFRPYLLTAVRQAASDSVSGGDAEITTHDQSVSDPGALRRSGSSQPRSPDCRRLPVAARALARSAVAHRDRGRGAVGGCAVARAARGQRDRTGRPGQRRTSPGVYPAAGGRRRSRAGRRPRPPRRRRRPRAAQRRRTDGPGRRGGGLPASAGQPSWR